MRPLRHAAPGEISPGSSTSVGGLLPGRVGTGTPGQPRVWLDVAFLVRDVVMSSLLSDFITQCVDVTRAHESPADCVEALAPSMLHLLSQTDSFLTDAHRKSDPAGYARNLIHATDDESLSLYALVWNPGQWTPVHDHGSWGVVGVVEGVLEERNYARVDDHHTRNDRIELVRSGVILLSPGAVTTFVPNPDHIHLTGVDAAREPVVSLHLYGRQMDNFYVYDVDQGTRRLIDVAHNKS